jgi:transcriptional regulator with XRE-family HTH domain
MFARLGLALRVARELSGLSVRGLAREAKIGSSQLSRYERGIEIPKLDSLGKVLKIIGLSPLSFFHLMHVLENTSDQRAVTSALMLDSSDLLSAPESARFQALFQQVLALYGTVVADRALRTIDPSARKEIDHGSQS